MGGKGHIGDLCPGLSTSSASGGHGRTNTKKASLARCSTSMINRGRTLRQKCIMEHQCGNFKATTWVESLKSKISELKKSREPGSGSAARRESSRLNLEKKKGSLPSRERHEKWRHRDRKSDDVEETCPKIQLIVTELPKSTGRAGDHRGRMHSGSSIRRNVCVSGWLQSVEVVELHQGKTGGDCARKRTNKASVGRAAAGGKKGTAGGERWESPDQQEVLKKAHLAIVRRSGGSSRTN